MPVKLSAKEAIKQTLLAAETPLAIHEMRISGHSETAISARLREMARAGEVVSFPVKGKAFKAWQLTPVSQA